MALGSGVHGTPYRRARALWEWALSGEGYFDGRLVLAGHAEPGALAGWHYLNAAWAAMVDAIGMEEAEKLMDRATIPGPDVDPLDSDWGTSASALRDLQEIMALVPSAAPVT